MAGLLADAEDEINENTSSGSDALIELAVELDRANEAGGQEIGDIGELDWDDMQWVPDPVDAGPGEQGVASQVEDQSILTTLCL